MGKDKRRDSRLEVKLFGLCNGAPCEIKSISLGGLRYTTSAKLDPGTFADLTFTLPEKASYLFANPQDRTIHINVQVKRCQPLADGLFAVGAEVFEMLDGTDEPFWAYLLEEG